MGNRAAKRSVPEVLTDPSRVAGAIERARQSAAERKVPLTMERVAACLEVEPWEIRAAIIQAKSSRGRKSSAQKKAGRELEAVCADCRAFLVEQGLSRSSSAVMPIFCLRTHFGYTDRPEEKETAPAAVYFEGEDAIPE